MTSIKLYLNQTQRVGPLHVWPMRLAGLSSLNYQVPPKIENLFFREYDEGGGPEVGRIEVFNPTDIPVLIPSGWIVGGDLLQVRTFNASELVAPMESIIAKVSCVERGRWGQGKTEVDGGRAPLSVHASGKVFNRHSGLWDMNYETRQSSVWQRISTLEMRSGSRPTSSLQQIMREDSTKIHITSAVQNHSINELRIVNGQNGIMIAFEGEPLLLEAFSSTKALRATIQSTIRSLSFDIDHLDFEAISKEKVKDFVDAASLGRLSPMHHGLPNSPFLGGGQNVDTNAIKDIDGRLLHVTALNMKHRILQEA
jgi:hypothetical protein